MSDMISSTADALSKLRFPVLLLIVGFALIFGGYYEIKDLNIAPISNPHYELFAVGVLLLIAAVPLHLLLEKLRLGSTEAVNQKAEEISHRRFANLIYVYARDLRAIALGYHKRYGFYFPPGQRLDVHEPPHEKIVAIVRDQIGLDISEEEILSPVFPPDTFIVPDKQGQTIGETEICISPLWIQLEKHDHRPDKHKNPVSEHLDFIYLCVLEKSRPLGPGVRADYGWFTDSDLQEMLKTDSKKRTLPDVYRGFQMIESFLANRN